MLVMGIMQNEKWSVLAFDLLLDLRNFKVSVSQSLLAASIFTPVKKQSLASVASMMLNHWSAPFKNP